MKHCPFTTIAKSEGADQVVNHGACQEEACALWDPQEEQCCILSIAQGNDHIQAAILVASERLSQAGPPLKSRQ